MDYVPGATQVRHQVASSHADPRSVARTLGEEKVILIYTVIFNRFKI